MNVYNTHVARTTRIQKTGNARPMQGITVKTLITSGAANNVIPPSSSVEDNGIRLEFAQFGHFTSFDVIRSMVSMASVADADLPTPIATGLKTMYYVDRSVVEGLTYYYKVRVWRGSESFVSEEVSIVAREADKYWTNVISLLHFDGVNNSTTINDSKLKEWRVIGNAKLSNENSVFSGSSLKLDGNQSYIDSEVSDPFNLNGHDFTIECFAAIINNTATPCIASQWSGNSNHQSWALFFLSSGVLCFRLVSSPNNFIDLTFAFTPVSGRFYHYAVERVGSTFRVFIDGAVVTTHTSASYIYNTPSVLRIGGAQGFEGILDLNGFVDEFRYTIGFARYQGEFTPPTKPFPDL